MTGADLGWWMPLGKSLVRIPFQHKYLISKRQKKNQNKCLANFIIKK